MGKLSDILNGHGGDFNNQWDETEAAGDFGPVPRGNYVCHATKGELETSRNKGTPGYKIEFSIVEGEHTGRKVWHDCWLTAAALPQSKRDLAKLGIKSPAQMEQPLPRWIRCKVTVVIVKDDDGVERNKVRTFEAIGFDKAEADPFAPKPSGDGPTPPGNAAEPDGEADLSFLPDRV